MVESFSIIVRLDSSMGTSVFVFFPVLFESDLDRAKIGIVGPNGSSEMVTLRCW